MEEKEQNILTEEFQVISVEEMRKIENHYENTAVIIVTGKNHHSLLKFVL